MSSSINKNVNVERRTWDKESFEARARSRAAAEAAAAAAENNGASSVSLAPIVAAAGPGDSDAPDAAVAAAAIKNEIDPTEEKEEFLPAKQGRAGPMGSKRAFLKSRSKKVDLEGKLGSTEIIDPTAASVTRSNNDSVSGGDVPPTRESGVTKCTDGVGWHCRVCDCFLKDSLTYLDHINGKKHQRYLGYSMRVEKSTTEEVCTVLKGLAEKKREREGFGSGVRAGAGASAAVIDFADVVRKKDGEALRRKAERARRREERKRRGKEEGIGGLVQLNAVAESIVEEKHVTEGNNPAEEEEGEDEGEGGMDPNLAAMMGFSGFGGSRK